MNDIPTNDMPVNHVPKRRWRDRIWRSACAAIGLCAVAAPAMADEWVQTLPNLWVSATALSLTLVTAVGRPKK